MIWECSPQSGRVSARGQPPPGSLWRSGTRHTFSALRSGRAPRVPPHLHRKAGTLIAAPGLPGGCQPGPNRHSRPITRARIETDRAPPCVKSCKRRALPSTSGDNERILMVSMAAARLSLWPFRAIATASAVRASSVRFRFSSQRLVTCWGTATPVQLERQTHPDAGPGGGAA